MTPRQVVFISLPVVFEAAAGHLILSTGRRPRLGLAGAIAFSLAPWLFG